MAESPDYRSLPPLLYRLIDIFADYSMSPPKASLEDYGVAESALKSWLASNAIDSDEKVWRSAKEIGVQCRNYFLQGTALDGRPDPTALREWRERLDRDVESVIVQIRSLRGGG